MDYCIWQPQHLKFGGEGRLLLCFCAASPLCSFPLAGKESFEITSVPGISHHKPLTHRNSHVHPVALTKKPNQNMLLQNQAPQPPALHYEHGEDLEQQQKLQSPEHLQEASKPWDRQQQGKSVGST